MQTLSNLLENNKVIATLKEIDSEKYNAIFGESYDASILDNYINFYNANYIVNIGVETFLNSDTFENLCKIIWLKFFDKWKKLLETLAVKYDKSFSESETTKRDKTDNQTGNTTDKIFGYDSETSSNQNLTETTDDKTENENTTREKSGYRYDVSLFTMLTKYNDFASENIFCDCVKDDIVNFLCYLVY